MSGVPAGAGSLLGKRLGKYEILALLALGGTAEIYLARIGGAAGFEKYVVVKCLHDHLADDAEFVKMFLDEARLAAHLDHSNIVQTMELGEHEGRYYMVMEYLAGLSLAMIVRRAGERISGGRIPVPLVLNMVAQACAGLHYAHERVVNGRALHIVHRDISPQNLVVSFEGVVKVVDFGIAKAELRETRTRSGTIKGKFAYMSPEQCVANNVDRRTDVFALGVIAHELLTGRRLFKKASPYETYQAVIECAIPPPSQLEGGIDPAIDPVVMRALEKDRERRFPTAEAFGDALLGYLHHRGLGSGPGDVSRFFDASFPQEIEDYGARMRELISGREPAEVSEVVGSWSADRADDDEARPGQSGAATAAARAAGEVAADASLSAVIGELGAAAESASGLASAAPVAGDSDEDLPAERTRIEANPLGRINALEAERASELARAGAARGAGRAAEAEPARGAAAPVAAARGATGEPSVRAAPLGGGGHGAEAAWAASAPSLRAEGPSPAAPARAQPAPRAAGSVPIPTARGMHVPGALAEPASQPTVISELPALEAAAASSDPRDAPAAASAPSPGPRAPDAPAAGPSAAPDLGPRAAAASPAPTPDGAQAASAPSDAARGGSANAAPVGPSPGAGASPGLAAAAPRSPGYPGPAHGGAGAIQVHGPGAPGGGARGPIGAPLSGYPVMSSELRDQLASGATVFPSSLGSGPQEAPPAFDAPAGMRHPRSGWAAGSAPPVRGTAPWKLAVIFVGALGSALLITALIALAAR